jgi:hypothetical protein
MEINNPGASSEVLKGVCLTNTLVSDTRVGVFNHFYKHIHSLSKFPHNIILRLQIFRIRKNRLCLIAFHKLT